MTKSELAGYLSSIITIMDSKEDAGIPRGNTLAREYTRVYTELVDIIRKEEDEARNRK